MTNRGKAATPVGRVIRVLRKSGIRFCDQNTRHWGMIRKSGYRFSEKIMLKQKDRAFAHGSAGFHAAPNTRRLAPAPNGRAYDRDGGRRPWRRPRAGGRGAVDPLRDGGLLRDHCVRPVRLLLTGEFRDGS